MEEGATFGTYLPTKQLAFVSTVYWARLRSSCFQFLHKTPCPPLHLRPLLPLFLLFIPLHPLPYRPEYLLTWFWASLRLVQKKKNLLSTKVSFICLPTACLLLPLLPTYPSAPLSSAAAAVPLTGPLPPSHPSIPPLPHRLEPPHQKGAGWLSCDEQHQRLLRHISTTGRLHTSRFSFGAAHQKAPPTRKLIISLFPRPLVSFLFFHLTTASPAKLPTR